MTVGVHAMAHIVGGIVYSRNVRKKGAGKNENAEKERGGHPRNSRPRQPIKQIVAQRDFTSKKIPHKTPRVLGSFCRARPFFRWPA